MPDDSEIKKAAEDSMKKKKKNFLGFLTRKRSRKSKQEAEKEKEKEKPTPDGEVPLKEPDRGTYHCGQMRKMHITKADATMAFAFYLRNDYDFRQFC